MRRAAGLYRLHLAIALGGGLGVVLGVLVAVDAATTHQQPPRMLVAAILFSTSPIAGADAALLLSLGAIVTGSLVFGLRAAAIEYHAHRRAGRVLRASQPLPVDSTAICVIGENQPRAFCHGLLRPRIYVSTGAIAALSAPQLAALLAHERHHARRRDPLRLAVARVLGGALFFLPILPWLLEHYTDEAELAADEAALREGQDVAALAAALLTFDEHGAGVHPDRVDWLMGERVDTPVPTASILAAAAIIVALVGLGLAGGIRNGHDYSLVAIPALFVATGLAAAALVAPFGLLSTLVAWRRGRRPR